VLGRRTIPARMRAGLARGASIHAGVAGLGPDGLAVSDDPVKATDDTAAAASEGVDGVGTEGVEGDVFFGSNDELIRQAKPDEYDRAASIAAINESVAAWWPGIVWQREHELSVQLTPGILLHGILDAWTATPDAIVQDLKTSTAYSRSHARACGEPVKSPNLQLCLYARLVLEATGKVPQVWQVRHNPRSLVTYRRPYFISEMLIEQACAQAVRAALALEGLFRQAPSEWARSFQCGPDSSSAQYSCPHSIRCMQDLGGRMADGTEVAKNVHILQENTRFTRPLDQGQLQDFIASFRSKL
jgi:hypothetical protein